MNKDFFNSIDLIISPEEELSLLNTLMQYQHTEEGIVSYKELDGKFIIYDVELKPKSSTLFD